MSRLQRQESDRPAGPRRERRAGFTLMEVLIALAVLAVTMTAAFSVFSSGLKLRAEVRDRLAFYRDARLLITALADDLANLVPTGPAPLVAPDGIVLWRSPPEIPGGESAGRGPQLVTYRWSGSTVRDSLLVRMSTELDIDIADSALVNQEFMKWAAGPEISGEFGERLVRIVRDSGFGSEATLNGLSGTWVGYPRIKACQFRVTGGEKEMDEEVAHARLQVRLMPEASSIPVRSFDMMPLPELLAEEKAGIEFGLWMPWGVPGLDLVLGDPALRDRGPS